MCAACFRDSPPDGCEAGTGSSLFAYGSLMHPPVLEAVTGRTAPQCCAAVLRGYQRGLIHGQTFPGIIEAEDSRVEGRLFRGLDREDLRRLDIFEGRLYRRLTAAVEVDGSREQAQIYVLSCEGLPLWTDIPWSLEKFLRDDLQSFMAL